MSKKIAWSREDRRVEKKDIRRDRERREGRSQEVREAENIMVKKMKIRKDGRKK